MRTLARDPHAVLPHARAAAPALATRGQVLVASDVASRGLDVRGLPYVVSYDCPSNLEAYVHRVGRTGRLAASGHAFTFFTRPLVSAAGRWARRCIMREVHGPCVCGVCIHARPHLLPLPCRARHALCKGAAGAGDGGAADAARPGGGSKPGCPG